MPGRSPDPPRPPDRSARLAGAASLALGLGLLALALPVAGAALSRLPGDRVVHDLRAGTGVTAADLGRLADSRRAAAGWRADPRDAAELALAQLLLAERAGPDRPTGAARLRAAERALTAGLASAPADPYAWTRLALVRWHLGRPAATVRAALAAARTAGPAARRLLPVQRALAARLTRTPDARSRDPGAPAPGVPDPAAAQRAAPDG